jgi:hypothetical protein
VSAFRPSPRQVLAYAQNDVRQRRRVLARIGPKREAAAEAARHKLALAEASYAALARVLEAAQTARSHRP